MAEPPSTASPSKARVRDAFPHVIDMRRVWPEFRAGSMEFESCPPASRLRSRAPPTIISAASLCVLHDRTGDFHSKTYRITAL
jgi:hypothetical protein